MARWTLGVALFVGLPVMAIGGGSLWENGCSRTHHTRRLSKRAAEPSDEAGRLTRRLERPGIAFAPVSSVTPPPADPSNLQAEQNPDHAAGTGPLQETSAASLSELELKKRLWEQFSTEARDPQWSGQADAIAKRQVASGVGTGSKVQSIDCRESMCRIELTHTDLQTFQAYMTNLIGDSEREWKGSVMGSVRQTRPDGSIEAELYLFRFGENPLAKIHKAIQDDHAAQL